MGCVSFNFDSVYEIWQTVPDRHRNIIIKHVLPLYVSHKSVQTVFTYIWDPEPSLSECSLRKIDQWSGVSSVTRTFCYPDYTLWVVWASRRYPFCKPTHAIVHWGRPRAVDDVTNFGGAEVDPSPEFHSQFERQRRDTNLFGWKNVLFFRVNPYQIVCVLFGEVITLLRQWWHRGSFCSPAVVVVAFF